MKFKFLLLLGAIFVSTIKLVGQARYQESQARTLEPRSGIVATPMVADFVMLNDGKKISETIVGNVVVTKDIGQMINEYKNNALAKVLEKHGADVMFATIYEITTNPQNTLTIKITGYPAKYTNFRVATQKDAWMADLYLIIDRNQTVTGSIKQQTIIAP